MKRITVLFDEAMIARLETAAERDGLSTDALVRDAVARYLDGTHRDTALPSIVGGFGSSFSDTSERVDDLLWPSAHG